STPGAHAAGSKVTLHGYSLEVRRKIRMPALLGGSVETQVPDNDSREIIWGQGGLRCAETLLSFNFPPGVVQIFHLDLDPALIGAQGDFVVPLFHLGTGRGVVGGWFIDTLGAILPSGERNAVDYFQSKGVLSLDGRAFLYQQEDLPPQFIAAQARFLQVSPAQTKGLRILGDYPPTPGQDPLASWKRLRARTGQGQGPRSGSYVVGPVTQCSLLASGPIGNLYPRTGVIEIRGAPRASWEAYRPNYSGQPAFGKNPDDVVEWLRYVEIHENMFVGRTGSNFNFRGYPESDRPGMPVDLRKQLDHMAGEPIRLVMELSEGGAGYGDYVTIATSDPSIHEPIPRRVYKSLEHDDGRFFVSLLDVSESGIDMPASPGIYKYSYTRAMNPRLVKFPSWGLPEIRTGSGLFFGDSVEGAGGSSARSNAGGVRNDEDEDPTGITIDEVRRFQNRTVRHEPTYGTRVRYVVVPLDGGAVRFQAGGPGKSGISGAIPAGRAISRSSPLEVLVVSVSRERGLPFLFARGEKEGVLRIGRELFYFEDPDAGAAGGGAGAVAGTATLNARGNVANSNAAAAPGDDGRQRDPLERTTVFDRISVSNMTGRFEEEGFARLADRHLERIDFYEVFYYRRRQGGFSQCLRGQFGTPIALNAQAGTIHNVTRRLRLVARGLLGSEPAHHGLGDSVAFVPYATVSPVTGPLTTTGLPVKDAKLFARSGGYVLLDPAMPGAPWEILGHLGPAGDGLLACARDERGRALFRASFGTKELPISNEILAYEIPYRYPDRYEPEADSESLAYLQKSYRVPGAYWRSIEWLERPPRSLQERRAEIVIVLRFEGAPGWDSKPTNTPGGLYIFQAEEGRDQGPVRFDIDRVADQVELRVYFRYLSGAFSRLPGNHFRDDWKETPVLEALTLEYEKAGTVVRHEELPF
ncbi:MAG TPA: hypothetical protein VMT52_14915, partial [Planctomycetota bacterium]|nr:hypothetical protein [Planctomycetota bacterium]